MNGFTEYEEEKLQSFMKSYRERLFGDVKLCAEIGECLREGNPDEISFHDNGGVRFEGWVLEGEYHREDGPARIHYREDGSVISRFWCLNGEPHRIDGPAIEEFSANGEATAEIWYRNGKMFRLDGPAYIVRRENSKNIEYWNVNGRDITALIASLLGSNVAYPLRVDQQECIKYILRIAD